MARYNAQPAANKRAIAAVAKHPKLPLKVEQGKLDTAWTATVAQLKAEPAVAKYLAQRYRESDQAFQELLDGADEYLTVTQKTLIRNLWDTFHANGEFESQHPIDNRVLEIIFRLAVVNGPNVLMSVRFAKRALLEEFGMETSIASVRRSYLRLHERGLISVTKGTGWVAGKAVCSTVLSLDISPTESHIPSLSTYQVSTRLVASGKVTSTPPLLEPLSTGTLLALESFKAEKREEKRLFDLGLEPANASEVADSSAVEPAEASIVLEPYFVSADLLCVSVAGELYEDIFDLLDRDGQET